MLNRRKFCQLIVSGIAFYVVPFKRTDKKKELTDADIESLNQELNDSYNNEIETWVGSKVTENIKKDLDNPCLYVQGSGIVRKQSYFKTIGGKLHFISNKV